jgi:hypothetical protein
MSAHMDGASLPASPTDGLGAEALAELWEQKAGAKQPIGPCKRRACAGVLVPSYEEMVGNVLWLTAVCTHCRAEVTMPDGRRAKPVKDPMPRPALARARVTLTTVEPPDDWRNRAYR